MKKSRKPLALLAFLGAALWASNACATPDFPGAVEQYLGLAPGTLASKVDPPCGCPLCHVNGCGGGPPLTDFGTLMQANGAVPFEAAETAGPALAAIGAQEPQLITDLENGTDPNLDPSLTGAGGVHYGCEFAAAPSSADMNAILLMAGGVRLARRKSRTAARPSST